MLLINGHTNIFFCLFDLAKFKNYKFDYADKSACFDFA